MSATPPSATERLSRQMQAALHLKRRYEAVLGKTVSITSLRKDPELLDAVRTEVALSGDRELQYLFDVAFSENHQDVLDAGSVSAFSAPAPTYTDSPVRDRTAGARRWWVVGAALVALIAVSWASLRYSRQTEAPAPAAPAPSVVAAEPRVLLRLQGSNTIGEKLAPMLVQAFFASEGNVDIQVQPGANPVERTVLAREANKASAVAAEVKAHGSATAFTALETGAADVGMSSRPINSAEIERLAPKLGDLTQPGAEHVLGLDGIAVVVNPGNPITALTVEQVARNVGFVQVTRAGPF